MTLEELNMNKKRKSYEGLNEEECFRIDCGTIVDPLVIDTEVLRNSS